MPKLTPDQIRILKKISDPEIRRKYTICYQLPQKVQDILFATETADKIQEIILKRYGLSREQLWIGSYITGMVLLGITPLKEFSQNLEEKLEVAPDIAQAITRDINEQIFAEVSEELKEIHKEFPKEVKEVTPEAKPERTVPEPTPIRPPAPPDIPKVKAEPESEKPSPVEPPEIYPPEVPDEPEISSSPRFTPSSTKVGQEGEGRGPKIKGNLIDLKGSVQEDEPEG